MMNVVNCVVGQHNPFLVLLAAVVCVTGSWVTVRLCVRTADTQGAQHFGWVILGAVAGGSAIWSTHFVAMLGYDPNVAVTFDPVLTILSLIVAIGGTGLGLGVATSRHIPLAAPFGGALVGLAISAMHYVGMFAYRVDGLVTWNAPYVVSSVVLAIVLGSLALTAALRDTNAGLRHIATLLLVLAIVSLHFTGMTAFEVAPLDLGATEVDKATLHGMAISIAVVGLVITASGLASYLIDDHTRADFL